MTRPATRHYARGSARRGTRQRDAVNVAARVEQLTKLHGTAILVSDETRRRVGAAIRFSAAPVTAVRGKSEALRTYVPTVAGLENAAHPGPHTVGP